MVQEKGLVTEEPWDSTAMVGMFTAMIFMLLLPFILQTTVMAQEAMLSPRIPVRVESLEAISGNVGTMWYKITPLGQPNELRMIGENSTGAFEEILISLST